jgi:hypothetical protein
MYMKCGLSPQGKKEIEDVWERRVLRRIFRVIGGYRKLNYEELHNVYFSPNISDQVKGGELGRTCNMHTKFSQKTVNEEITWQT